MTVLFALSFHVLEEEQHQSLICLLYVFFFQRQHGEIGKAKAIQDLLLSPHTVNYDVFELGQIT